MLSEFWNQKFEADSYLYGIHPNHFLAAHIHHFKPGSKVLSLGEGEGRNAVYLAEHGVRVTAIDVSNRGFEKLDKLATEKSVSISKQLGNLLQLNWDNAEWDGIINIFCHLSYNDRQVLYQKIKKGLKPGGIYLSEMFTPDQLKFSSGGPGHPDMMVTESEYRSAFEGFELIHLETKITHLDEGRHHGDAAVVQVIARKQDVNG